MLAVGIFIFGALSRLVVHIPNFSPVVALALFGGVYLKRKQAVLLPVLLLGVTDIFLGTHPTAPFTWGAVALIALLGLGLRGKKNFLNIAAASLGSALLFFVVTNFGVWLVTGMYAHTFAGLADCFALAIPFFRHTLVSTAVYTVIFFGAYEWLAGRVRNTSLAHTVL